MEIRPGRGTDQVALGETRSRVEARLGEPDKVWKNRSYYNRLRPALVVDYGGGSTVELIEVPYEGAQCQEVTLQGIQLTYRLMKDVMADLTAAGYLSRASDVGFDFAAGFAIWSMSSLDAREVDPSASPEDDRAVVEGVSVGAPEYFGF